MKVTILSVALNITRPKLLDIMVDKLWEEYKNLELKNPDKVIARHEFDKKNIIKKLKK